MQYLSNLLLNIVTDVELTTSSGKLFQILKRDWKRYYVDRVKSELSCHTFCVKLTVPRIECITRLPKIGWNRLGRIARVMPWHDAGNSSEPVVRTAHGTRAGSARVDIRPSPKTDVLVIHTCRYARFGYIGCCLCVFCLFVRLKYLSCLFVTSAQLIRPTLYLVYRILWTPALRTEMSRA